MLLRGLMGAVEAMGGSMVDYRTPEERGEEEKTSGLGNSEEKPTKKEQEGSGGPVVRATSESVEELGQETAVALERVSEKVSKLLSEIAMESSAAKQPPKSKQKAAASSAEETHSDSSLDKAASIDEETEWMTLHTRAISCLVSSVKEDAPALALSGGQIRLSPAHFQALVFIGQTLKQVQEGGGKVAACFKWVPKKHGLNRYLNRLDQPPSFASPRDRLLLSRDIERALSETLIFLSSLAALSPSTRPDFLESVRLVLEHTPVRHRHASLLSLSSFYRKHPSISPPLSHSLRTSFSAAAFPFATSAPRTAFPLLEAAHRALLLQRSSSSSSSSSAGLEEEEEGGAGESVGALLERVTAADPSGHTAQALQRWAEGGVVNPLVDKEEVRKIVQADNLRGGSAVTKSPLALQLLSFYANVPPGPSPPSETWSVSLLAVGAHVRAMATARDSEGKLLEGRPLVEAVNAQMMVTSLAELESETAAGLKQFVNTMVEGGEGEGEAWREGTRLLVGGLQQLVGGSAEEEAAAWMRGAAERKESARGGRREAAEGGGGSAASARAEEQEEAIQRGLSRVLWEWRQPALLLQLPLVLASDPEAYRLALTFLRCIVLSDGDGLEKTRFQHPRNREHLALLDPEVVKRWQALDNVTPATVAGDGDEPARFGTRDPQALLMMGEDAGTCMAVHPTNKRTVKGLLGYLLQGNARMLCCTPLLNPAETPDVLQGLRGVRWGSRAIARLLLRRDTGETVLFVDRPYHVSDRNATAEAVLWQQAEALARHLQVQLLRPFDAAPPDAVLENLRPPTVADSYPYPAIELLEGGGVSPFVWRDGRFHVGLLYRGEEARTALGGSRIAVGVLFGGWSDDLGAFQRARGGGGNGTAAADMGDVQAIGAAIATHVRGTRTLEKKRKKLPWELTF